MSAMVFIISAPSGSGKSTLVSELRKAVAGLEFSISYTTRNPRGSEKNGREYYFITRPEFESMLARDEFLEHADVFGNYYGTARSFLRDAQARGHDLLLDIDVQGAAQIKRLIPQAASIFVLPPSRAELERRLLRRSQAEGVTAQQIIQRRLHTAAREIENWEKYDYILVNDRLEESIDQLKAIVLSERSRHAPGAAGASADEHFRLAGLCRKEQARARVLAIQASFAASAAGGKA